MASVETLDGVRKITMPSSYRWADGLRRYAERKMRHAGYDEGSINGVSTAIYEALSNAIRWGNGEAREKPVEVLLDIDPRYVDVHVNDCGTQRVDFSTATTPINEMTPEQLLEVISDSYAAERHSRIGMNFMRIFMDVVEFTDIVDLFGEKVGTEVHMAYRRA